MPRLLKPFVRDDAKYGLMYIEYQKGFSLSDVGVMFSMTRQAVWEGFKNRGLKLRTKKPLPHLFFNGLKYTLRNTGYYGLTNDDRRLMHRDVWEFYNGKILPNFDIHHIDGNRQNNDIKNLELYTKSEHSSKFSTGHNQHTVNNGNRR